ncbi:MAG: hypothetical protein IJH90_03375 [Mogibacterium sp.]|nr:hypothetical protein [Mogibacterium sp.]
MKKFRRSPITIACYVIAALIVVYFCVTAVSTIRTIDEYYAQYGMTGTFTEYVTYIFQNGFGTLVNAIMIFMAGLIYDAVRKLDPNNWKTDEELAEEKAAKKLPKDASAAAAAADAKDIVEFDKAEEAAEESAEAADENAEVVEAAAVEEAAVEEVEAVEEAAEEVEEVVEAAEPAEETAEAEEAAEAGEVLDEELEDAGKVAGGTAAADML